MGFRHYAAGVALALLFGGCSQPTPKQTASTPPSENAKSQEPGFVSDAVRKRNQQTTNVLDFNDRRDFDRAEKGFIATRTDPLIKDENGRVTYDLSAFDFMNAEAPDTVNPSLWRQGQLISKHGLFEVGDGMYQVRGFDLSNITFIRGETGWIVVDPLISKDTAAAAKVLIDSELGQTPISAVIFTHSHADHFGGVRGLIDEADVATGVQVIAPDGFVLESVSENILAGNAMSRRASYMFGGLLSRDAQHSVGVGLGPGLSTGDVGLVRPTINVTETGETHVIDGVEMEFIMALESEAPSEFMFYMPGKRAFFQAEVINHTFHNMYTPRGAKVRDGRRWSGYIDEAIYKYADKTDVSFGAHHWPVWGSDEVTEFWAGQRDLYRYVHDQTVRLANMGHTMHEIPALLDMPDGIAKSFANRDYYGTVSHNSKAQYQLYYGYFDGNPANLDPLPPVAESKKFVDYMGGADAVMEKAQADFDKGEFRFAATALNKVVFADPDNQAARDLLADTYTQLGYTAESGSWRNFYLTGAQELRGGVLDLPQPAVGSEDIVKAVPLELYFDLLAVRLNGPKAAKKDRDVNFVITDTGEKAHLIISNGTLHHRMGQTKDGAPTINITRAGLDKLNLKQADFGELSKSGEASIDGNPLAVRAFFGLIEEPEYWFEIVRP